MCNFCTTTQAEIQPIALHSVSNSTLCVDCSYTTSCCPVVFLLPLPLGQTIHCTNVYGKLTCECQTSVYIYFPSAYTVTCTCVNTVGISVVLLKKKRQHSVHSVILQGSSASDSSMLHAIVSAYSDTCTHNDNFLMSNKLYSIHNKKS